MRATQFRARVYDPGSPHPRPASVSLDGQALVVRYDEGGEFLLPFDELELKPGQLSQERVVLSSQSTRQSLVADDRRLLSDISGAGAPDRLKRQISKNDFDRKVGFVKRSLGQLVLLGVVVVFLGFLFIGFFYSVRHGDGNRNTDTEQETEEQGGPPAAHSPGAPVVPGGSGEEFAGASAYMKTVQTKIKRGWHPPKTGKSRRVTVVFSVQSDGELGQVKIDKSSGVKAVDQAAIDAVKRSAPFPPIPPAGPESVDIQFTFDYNVHNR